MAFSDNTSMVAIESRDDSDLQNQLALLSLEYSKKYGAFVCTACKSYDQDDGIGATGLLDEEGLVEHLRLSHSFTSKQLQAVRRLANRIYMTQGHEGYKGLRKV